MRAAGRTGAAAGRRGRLRLLTGATVAAWLAAVVVTGVPALAGGAGSGTGPASAASAAPARPGASANLVGTPGPTEAPQRNAKPSNAPRGTAKPAPTPKGGPKSTPTPSPAASATPTLNPTATPKPTADPKPTHRPRPTPAASPGAGNGGTTGPKGGSSPAGASSGPATKGAGGIGPGRPGATGEPDPDVFGVPGADPLLAAEAAAARASGGGGDSVDAEIYLDVRFAGSMDLLAPAALLAVPALLIALSLMAQIAGGLLWIPLTNRVLGSRAPRP